MRFAGSPKFWSIVAAVLLAAIAAILFGVDPVLNGWARKHAAAYLSRRFDSQVEFSSLKVALLPRPAVRGRGLVFRHHGRRDVPPLVEVREFEARAGFLSLWPAKPRHIGRVTLKGLVVNIPPRGEKKKQEAKKAPSESNPVLIQDLVCEDSRVVMLPKEGGKQPNVFQLYRLHMRDIALDRPAPFEASLSNPRPPGHIDVEGTFGPWDRDEPSNTPLAARYTFRDANLGAFHGISGILSSQGRFQGVLDHIDVEGSTDTPDFSVRRSEHTVNLHTDFKAVVDGTNGNTYLTSVIARFGQSVVDAHGEVAKRQGESGRTVALDVTVDQGRVEDMLRLAVSSDKPALAGPIRFTTKFELPPGQGKVMDRLLLDGRFGIESGQFSKLNVREKIEALSRRGQGQPKNPEAGSDISELRGHFQMSGGVIRLSDLTFEVPGAAVKLNGTYAMTSGELDFRGTLRLAAKVSETTTGVKSFFLKLVDPLFKKKSAGAGAVIPIKVTGTKEDPKFGLDIGRTLKGS